MQCCAAASRCAVHGMTTFGCLGDSGSGCASRCPAAHASLLAFVRLADIGSWACDNRASWEMTGMADETQTLPSGLQLTELDPSFREDPHTPLARLREEEPVRRDVLFGAFF